MHPPPPLSRSLVALLAGLLGTCAQAQIATWTNPGNGSWLDASNWSPATVPGTNSPVVISNGGSALLSGIAQTPLLTVLNIGVSNFGNGHGSMISSGTAVRSSGPFFVGYATGGGNRVADGRLEIGLADGQASSAFVGMLLNATVAAQATGVLQVDGALPLNGSLYAGANFRSPAGSAANGRVSIGGDAGTVDGLHVGETFLATAAQVGGSNQGLLQIGGNLRLGSGALFNVGTTGFVDRVADPAAAGGFRLNQASGKVQIAGTLTLSGAAVFTTIGTSEGGLAEAAVTLGALDTRAGRFAEVSIGRSGARGQAVGSFAAASGDLRATQSVSVGMTSGGSSDGSLLLGSGSLLGSNNGATLSVGVASGDNLPAAAARGSVDAGGGVAGFAGYSVGNVFTRGTAGTRAEGSVIGGSSAGPNAAGSVTVGTIFGSGENVQAQGSLVMGSSLLLQNAFVAVGENDSASRGSRAAGELRIGGDAGTSIGMSVGNVPNFANANQVGSSASGVVRIAGSLALASNAFAFVGTTDGYDRVADPAAPGGVRINQGQGVFDVGGVLSVGASNLIGVGSTVSGVAEGRFSAATLAMGSNRLNVLSIGNSGNGQALGQMQIGSGDLRVTGNVQLGSTAGGSADGTLALLAGQLQGNNRGGLIVGYAATAPGPGQASGDMLATAGVNGFTSYDVGVVSGAVGAGTRAMGRLMAGSEAGASDITGISVGSVFNTAAEAHAQGSMDVGNALRVQSGGVLAVGHNFDGGRGSTAQGSLHIRGDAGSPLFTIIGDVFNGGSPAQVGNRSTAVLQIDGNLSVPQNSSAQFGTTTGLDRVADAGAPGGMRFNEARADARIGGTLSFGANTTLFVGTTEGGIAAGSLAVGRVEMGTSRLALLPVGVAFGAGNAQGRLEIGGGLLRADLVQVGASGGGSASGTIVLSNATLEAQNLFAGTGVGGGAQISLSDARARIAQDLVLQAGSLALDRSLVEVFDELSFSDDSSLQVDIDGLARTLQYGAINARHSTLAGVLEIDFSELVFSGDAAAFDILRSDGANGIDGDFKAYSFVAVPAGYRASAGIELDGAEVYRVRLKRQLAVPEPASWLLAALALALIASRRRNGCRHRPAAKP